jgi:peptide/nickel transport system substrate-binding protein
MSLKTNCRFVTSLNSSNRIHLYLFAFTNEIAGIMLRSAVKHSCVRKNAGRGIAMITRRRLLKSAGLGLTAASFESSIFNRGASAGDSGTLTIAYPTGPTALDGNTGPQAVSPGAQSLYRTLYDPYIVQNRDLTLSPGVMEKFAWNEDKSKISMTLRSGVKWHDGEPVTIDDVAWNMKRLTDARAPLASIFASMKNFKVEESTVTFDVDPWRANMMERLTFLGCYLLPRKYFEKVGPEGFERQPIGSGPYMFDRYERGSFLRLRLSRTTGVESLNSRRPSSNL